MLTTRRTTLVLLLLAVALTAQTCALRSTTRHLATGVIWTGSTALLDLQQAEIVLYDGKQVPAPFHLAFHQRMEQILKLDKAIVSALKVWPVTQAGVPASFRDLMVAIKDLTQNVLPLLPEGLAKSQILQKILWIETTIADFLLERGAA